MKRWRRPLILIALLLLAGAAVNITVAWDSATRRLPRSGEYASERAWHPHRFDVPAVDWAAVNGLRADRRLWFREYPGVMRGTTALRSLGIDLAESASGSPEEILGHWGLLVGADGRVRLDLDNGKEESHGWPMRCLWGATLWDSENARQKPVSALLLGDPTAWLRDAHYLPLRPLPAGFAINTLFYTAILALPLSVFPIRRRLRARRGRCSKCGYDLSGLGGAGPEGGAPCPECGAEGRLRQGSFTTIEGGG